MSEAAGTGTPPVAAAASLYAPDGGAAAAAGQETQAATGGETTVAGGAAEDTIVGGQGSNTLTAGEETKTAAAEDTLKGGQGEDSIAAPNYDFKLPEGFVVDDTLSAEAKTVFAAAGVPVDKAQGLVDLFGKAMKASSDAQLASHTTQQQAWLTEINGMPEFTGPTRETSLASIGKLFDEFGTPEAKAALNSYGVGNNPALVKMMLKLASAISEGEPAAAGRPTGVNGQARGAPKTIGQSLYGDPKN